MKTVLLVEDEPNTSEIYFTQLKKEGYKVIVANSVTMALEKIKNDYPDLLILDLNLNKNVPGPKDGLDILKALRQEAKTKNMKVIVASNYNEREYPQLSELGQLGVLKFFLKVETMPEEITNYIKEILK